MLRSGKIQFLFVFFVLNFASSSTSSQKVKKRESSPPSAFMRIYAKLDHLSDRVDQLESNGNNDSFIANITDAIGKSNKNLLKKFEEIFSKKMEKFEENFRKVEKFEQNFKNIDENLMKIEKIEEHNEKKIDKLEENFSKMAVKVSELSHSLSVSASEGGVSEWCHSTCRDRVATWVNATDAQLTTSLDHINRCLTTQQTTTQPPTTTTQPPTTTKPPTTTSPIIVCHPIINPCLHGGTCQPNSTGNGYTCVCSKFSSGSRFQNFECTVENRCWRLSGTVYTVIESNLTWAEAKVKCESEHMSLAMPKDEATNRFLWDQLNPIYSAQEYLWLGLKRDQGGSGWFWVDGSGLGQYQGGWPQGHSKTVRGFMVLGLVNEKYMWYHTTSTDKDYALCETQLIFP